MLGATKRLAGDVRAGARCRVRRAATARRGSSRCASATCSARSDRWCRSSRRQIARGGPVTVTHPDMVRYFMTTREAADLVLTAASHADGEGASARARRQDERASVYVLKMGQPVRIYELAERMIRLAGFEPGEDIDIDVTGTAAGRAPARDPLRRARSRWPRSASTASWRQSRSSPTARGSRRGSMRLDMAIAARRPRRGRGACSRRRSRSSRRRHADDSAPALASPARVVDRRHAIRGAVSAVGARHERAGQPLEGLLAARRRPAAASMSAAGTGNEARPAAEPAAQRGDHLRRR